MPNQVKVNLLVLIESPEDLLPPERAVLWPPLYHRALLEGRFQVEYRSIDGRTLEMSFNRTVIDGKTTGVSVFGKTLRNGRRQNKHCSKPKRNIETCSIGHSKQYFKYLSTFCHLNLLPLLPRAEKAQPRLFARLPVRPRNALSGHMSDLALLCGFPLPVSQLGTEVSSKTVPNHGPVSMRLPFATVKALQPAIMSPQGRQDG